LVFEGELCFDVVLLQLVLDYLRLPYFGDCGGLLDGAVGELAQHVVDAIAVEVGHGGLGGPDYEGRAVGEQHAVVLLR
jgi:hypothetical protein